MGLGVLVKDGKQTSCALGVFLSSASFVAASCLDYRDNTNIHRPGTQYDVVVKDAYNGATRKYNVPFSNITVHPSYDPASGANNIAILQYNPENVGDYYNTVAAGPDLWDSIIYVQQGLEDMDDLKWGPLRSVEAAGEDEADSACSDFSQAYAKGNGTIACFRTPVDPPSSSLSACKVPYPLAYAKYKGTLYQAGVFSHAVVDGEDMCDFEKMRMYYTLFGNYIAFAQDTVGSRRTLVSMKNDDGVKPNDDPDFSVGGMTGQVIQEGARLLSGDFFTNQTDPDHHTGDTEDSEDKDSSDSGDGLSQGATIAIAVCCSVGAMLLAIGLFFAIRRWKTNRHMDRDPVLENNTRIILADEFAVVE
ncbi:hypothetical protein GGF46_001382 [Coemansia sp. RSA 552]|nr:hypothetical protein GGF46_001382 [Coemansia sp. RSA 552]